MPITFVERVDSRLGPNESVIFVYTAIDTDPLDANTEIDLRNALHAHAPSMYGGLYRANESITIEENLGNGWYVMSVRYESNEIEIVLGQTTFRYTTAGGTQHIQVSREHLRSYGTTPTDFKQLIGVQPDGSATGADIVVPVYEFEIEKLITTGQALDLRAAAIQLTGTTNWNSFYDLQEGEGLFLGARSQPHGNGTTTMTFSFAGRGHRTGVAIGDITGINVEAWELLWVYYEGNVPKWVYVERVYERGDWGLLGL
jgi:hypothetical protein